MVQTGVFEPNSSFSDWKEKQNEIMGEIRNSNCMHTDWSQPNSNFRPWEKGDIIALSNPEGGKYHMVKKIRGMTRKPI